ncbi:hypothetical protein BRC82_10050 [Halobacteriales archaeon QS_1_67_19]|nr:MAG: hypothetical protein BRC82_10050 [Halobacteriales archaeon QS_1_67_19]
MAKEVTTVSEEGYQADNQIRDFDLTIDATGEEAPDTLEALLAAYTSCYVPALRVGAEQRGVGDLGRIEIDATGELNDDDDKLQSVRFTVRTETDIDDDQADEVVARANQLCKVHDALKAELEADVTVDGGAA